MTNTAIFSPCRKYRYSLWRDWSGLFTQNKYVMFIGLNPSTADEKNDDPTIRRCISYAKAWGFDGLCMANIFAFRATEPKDMLSEVDPVGVENDRYLVELAGKVDLVIAAWGTLGVHMGRDETVRSMIDCLHYLRLTKEGYPGHPLYLPKDLRPIKWV